MSSELRELLKPWRARLAGELERVWAQTAASIVSTLDLPAATPWTPCANDDRRGRIVEVLAPHPDDELAGCGAALLAHRRADDRVRLLMVTDGRRSRALGLAPDEMARRRREEANRVSQALGAELVWIGLRESEWTHDELVEHLRTRWSKQAPTLLYAPSRIDYHPEHRRVAFALSEVISQARELVPCRVRIYSVQVPLTPVLANVVLGASADARELASIAECYVTQRETLSAQRRMRRYVAAWHRLESETEAEEFWEVSALAYEAVHRHTIQPSRPWRGLHRLPWSDPLSAVVGLRTRRTLRELAQRFDHADGR
jgi:LmbE family N-acetylglucosaminyl deacetylase